MKHTLLPLAALLFLSLNAADNTYADFPVRRDRSLTVILGGGPAAVAAAEAAQDAGWQAVIVTPYNHVGGMLAAANHSWLLNGTTGTSVPRPCGALKKELFARVMDSGAYPLLLTHCAGLLLQNNTVTGIATASKYGTAILRADAVIDASEEQLAANHLLGYPAQQTLTLEHNFEIASANSLTPITLRALNTPGLSWHPTIKDGTATISRIWTEPDRNDWLNPSRREMEARYATAKLHLRIRSECLGMDKTTLLRFGEVRTITPERTLPDTPNLLRIPAQLPTDPTTIDVRQLETQTAQAVRAFLAQPHTRPDAPAVIKSLGQPLDYIPDNSVNHLLSRIIPKPTQTFQTDVLVAGGGTGGSAAMTALADHKITALTVDMLPFLGGTTTAGGVSHNWHGYVKGAYQKFAQGRKKQGSAEISAPFFASVRYWDKIFRIADNKQNFLGNAVVCGATRDGARITSAIIYSAYGFRSITAKFYIDTTGDADLCAHAGLPTELGDPESGWIQSSSCWGVDPWYSTNFHQNHYSNDLDIVDPTDHADTIRGISLAHRRNSDYHISSLYTQRESRRIIGQAYLTLADIIRRKFQPDAIAVASCLFDTHGRATDTIHPFLTKDTQNAKDQEIHVLIPIGAYRPRDTENLFVASKAISGERGATTLCRMNPEVTNGGYAVGTVASHAVANHLDSLDQIDLQAIRQELRDLTILPDWAFTPDEPEWTLDYAIQHLDTPRGYLPALLMPKEQILPALQQKLASPGTNDPVVFAEALAWFGCADGQELLLSRLRACMKKDMAKFIDKGKDGYTITDVNGEDFSENQTNAYGYPEIWRLQPGRAFTSINNLLYRLARLNTPETIPLVLELAARADALSDTLRMGTTPYALARTDAVTTYAHERLWALATFFRNRPTPDAIPHLTRLLQTPFIGGNLCPSYWQDTPYFQITFLEIMLADALHRCGGPFGTQRLREFSTDARAVFRNMAIRCLQTPAPATTPTAR